MTSFRKYFYLALTVAACLFFSACESSSSGGGGSADAGAANGGGGAVSTGNVVFQFTRTQSANLPTGTGLVGFTFYNNPVPANGDVVLMTQAAFAPAITIQDVPTVAQSVVVQALDNNANPLFELTNGITVTSMQTTLIDLSGAVGTDIDFNSITLGPDPLNLNPNQTTPVQLTITGGFSNGSNVPFDSNSFSTAANFTTNNNSISISNSGVVTLNAGGGAGTITGSYTINSVTKQDNLAFSFSSIQATPANLAVNAGQVSTQVTVTFSDGNNAPQTVQENLNTSYAISPPVAGFTPNTNGTVTVANGLPSGTTANLVITHTSNNRTFTDTVVLTVN